MAHTEGNPSLDATELPQGILEQVNFWESGVQYVIRRDRVSMWTLYRVRFSSGKPLYTLHPGDTWRLVEMNGSHEESFEDWRAAVRWAIR